VALLDGVREVSAQCCVTNLSNIGPVKLSPKCSKWIVGSLLRFIGQARNSYSVLLRPGT
jgi:hypothetical protein